MDLEKLDFYILRGDIPSKYIKRYWKELIVSDNIQVNTTYWDDGTVHLMMWDANKPEPEWPTGKVGIFVDTKEYEETLARCK